MKDNGVGIKKDQLAQVFEHFNQAHDPLTRSHEGTGLGLALCKQLVLLHHGVIHAVSEHGQGSEFRILLPQLYKRSQDGEHFVLSREMSRVSSV